MTRLILQAVRDDGTRVRDDGQAVTRATPVRGVPPVAADRSGAPSGLSLRSGRHALPTDVDQRLHLAISPAKLQAIEAEAKRSAIRKARRELGDAHRHRHQALTASLLARDGNRLTEPEAIAIASQGTTTAEDITSGRLVSKTVTTHDGERLAVLTASGWTDRQGNVVAPVDAQPIALRQHRCRGASTSTTLVAFTDRPEQVRCSICGGATFREETP